MGLLLVFAAGSSQAQPRVRQVLVLQSFDRGNSILDHFTANLRVELDRIVGRPANVIQVVVGQTGFTGAPEQAVVDYIHAIFVDRPRPDLIITVAGPAAVFARRHRQQIFPDTPILFGAVDQRYLGDAPLGDNEAAVAAANDYPGFIEGILQLLPETRQVFMVMGAGQIGQFWRREFEDGFRRFNDRVTFTWSDDLSLPEILQRSASLPGNAVIFYFTFGTDASGAAYADERVLAELHAAANVPLFAAHSVFLGTGVVGGKLLPIDDLSRHAAAAAVRLLNGEPPASVKVPPLTAGSPTFDWRELQRWNIPESRLPAGSVVRHRGPSLWREYRGTVLGAAGALAIQAVLIAGLLYQRRARQRAEIESRKNLALAADASRRAMMSALTSSMSHELGQPLSAMMHNAYALQMMVAAKAAPPDTINEILSDIQAQGANATQIIDRHRSMLRSHQVVRRAIDLHAVIGDSLALVGHDLRARQVEVAVDLAAQPCVIEGDPVLLQQVLVNLLVNAMDAMAGTPPATRRVTISTDVRGADIDLVVRDTGTGLPAQLDGTVFTPFVTTKAHGVGIGLAIARTIVEAHGGTIAARNNPDGGAAFTITLHGSAMRGVRSGPPTAA